MRLLLITVAMAALAFGQTAGKSRACEAYLGWWAKQPAEVQGRWDVAETYRKYLLARAADAVDAESEIRLLENSGCRAPEWSMRVRRVEELTTDTGAWGWRRMGIVWELSVLSPKL